MSKDKTRHFKTFQEKYGINSVESEIEKKLLESNIVDRDQFFFDKESNISLKKIVPYCTKF